jgi:hypothetical protein
VARSGVNEALMSCNNDGERRASNSSRRKKACPFIFFDKGNILISKRYQLHPASATAHHPNGTTDAHSQKKEKKTKKQKAPLQYLGPNNSNTSTAKTTPEIQTLQKRRLQEGNSALTPSSPDQRS